MGRKILGITPMEASRKISGIASRASNRVNDLEGIMEKFNSAVAHKPDADAYFSEYLRSAKNVNYPKALANYLSKRPSVNHQLYWENAVINKGRISSRDPKLDKRGLKEEIEAVASILLETDKSFLDSALKNIETLIKQDREESLYQYLRIVKSVVKRSILPNKDELTGKFERILDDCNRNYDYDLIGNTKKFIQSLNASETV